MGIKSICGTLYDRPSAVEGVSHPDRSFVACVGAPFDGDGPVVTSIERLSDGRGPMGFYDRLVVWAGDGEVFECPAWAAEITFEFNRDPSRQNYF